MSRFIFLDRDGVINEDSGYVHKLEDFRLIPGVVEALSILKGLGYRFLLITNQSGIGRGYYSMDDFENFNRRVVEELAKNRITIEKTHVCPHAPGEDCDCRKPNPKSILSAKDEFGIDLDKSYMVGDHPSDIELGRNAGVRSIYVLTGHGKSHRKDLSAEPDFVADDLLEAARWIENEDKGNG